MAQLEVRFSPTLKDYISEVLFKWMAFLAGSGVHQFHFRVKFYSSDPCQLREEITRYQFFLQLKSDLQMGTMPSSLYQEIVELSALVLQCKW